MKHTFFKCTDSIGCRDTGEHCMFCDGGIQWCTACGQAEGELMPDCPGSREAWDLERDGDHDQGAQ